MPQDQKSQNIKQKQYCNKFNKGFEMAHIKKKKKTRKKSKRKGFLGLNPGSAT